MTAPAVSDTTSSPAQAESQTNVEPLSDQDVEDLRAVWSVLVDRMSDNPAMAVLLQSITLVKLDGPKAHIAPVAGQESTAGYIQTEHRKTALAEGLQQILGRPVQVIFEEESALAESLPSKADNASTPPSTKGSPSTASGSRQPARPTLDLDSARRLPLVNEVLNVFPDAMIIGMFQEQVAHPEPEPEAEAESRSESDSQDDQTEESDNDSEDEQAP